MKNKLVCTNLEKETTKFDKPTNEKGGKTVQSLFINRK